MNFFSQPNVYVCVRARGRSSVELVGRLMSVLSQDMKTRLCQVIVASGLVSLVSSSLCPTSVTHCANLSTGAPVVSQVHGQVFKRKYIDGTRQKLGRPSLVHERDVLSEGMEIETGPGAWAQISWGNGTTRVWSNSVVQIEPTSARTIFLGEAPKACDGD